MFRVCRRDGTFFWIDIDFTLTGPSLFEIGEKLPANKSWFDFVDYLYVEGSGIDWEDCD